jgi:hypothetical protein
MANLIHARDFIDMILQCSRSLECAFREDNVLAEMARDFRVGSADDIANLAHDLLEKIAETRFDRPGVRLLIQEILDAYRNLREIV